MLTLLQSATGFDHTPSWSKIGSHLVVIFNIYGEGMAVVMDKHAWPREAIHQQYTGVLTQLQGTTGFDHTPSWSKIGSHLMVIFKI